MHQGGPGPVVSVSHHRGQNANMQLPTKHLAQGQSSNMVFDSGNHHQQVTNYGDLDSQ